MTARQWFWTLAYAALVSVPALLVLTGRAWDPQVQVGDVMMLAACSCGETAPHQIARRRTADGASVTLWSSGALASRMGYALPGVPMRRPRTQEALELALRAGWLLLGEVELYDAEELGDLYRAAERAARGDGLPGTLRRLMAEQAAPRIELQWTVTKVDARGRVLEREARLPRLRWPNTVIIDFCGSTFSGRGRYQIFRLETRVPLGALRPTTAAFPTGDAFASQRDLFKHLFSEAGAVRVTTEHAVGVREE